MKKMKAFLFTVLAAMTSLSSLHGQTVHQIITVGNSFSPGSLTIQAGDSVHWMNSGMGFHNVVKSNGGFRCANGCDGIGGGNGDPSGNVWSFTLAFDDPGTVTYHCEIHGFPGGGMSGTITVQGAAPPSCTGLSSPANGATNFAVTASLTWAAATGSPFGYRLNVGTSPGGTQILNNFNAGNVTTYNPPGDYSNNALIYVKITPYNATGDATGCTEESFTTEVCTLDRTVNNATIPSGTYSALGELTSHTSTVASGSTVGFTSDTRVLLEHDFTVETGGIFDMFIQPCGNNPGGMPAGEKRLKNKKE